ncbi:hypothetical protein ACFY3M_48370 [Streptomyces mirabilis]|uniref:hypothetical protein n=1 Tax=Streptomyces mirabilis TaxID=68239 RepID=UPI0036B966DA
MDYGACRPLREPVIAGLPGAGLTGHDDHDRLLLAHRLGRRRREDHSVQHVEALLLAERDRSRSRFCHHSS